MAKDKKKEKKEKEIKEKKKGKSETEDVDTFSQLVTQKGKTTGALRITVGNAIDRSSDKLFVGSDYREIHSVNYEKPWSEILADVGHWTPLPFTHGMEMELIIADDAGQYPEGSELVFRMKEIVKEAIKIMDQILYEGRNDFLPVPDYIRQKILARPYGKEDIEKGYAMVIRYNLPNGNFVDIDSFARDGNVTAITYILELVTPPCEYVEELAYWASTLFLLAKSTLPTDLHIIASAINPASKEYMRGLTQADY